MYNPVTVVNQKNERVGAVTDMVTALPEGHYRSASSVFVFNEHGQLLLQKRSQHILSPGLLDKSVGGHVDVGESNSEAAYREMKEELGIEAVHLTLKIPVHIFEGYCVCVYTVTLPQATHFAFDPHEIDEVFWISPADLDTQMKKQPELFTPNFLNVWQIHRDTLCS